MKTALVLLLVTIATLLIFGHSPRRSLRRASIVNSVSELLSAERTFREQGIVTNSNPGFRAFRYTNAVAVGTTHFECEIAVESEWIRNYGFAALTSDGTVLWIDREFAPSIARSADGRLSIPQRFR